MDIVVPFDAREPKTRLAPALDADERAAFARTMLRDVLDALDALDVESTPGATDIRPTVLANAPVDVDAPVTVDERSLTDAVNAVLAERVGEPVAVVMADLVLATPRALGRLFAPDADVVVAPGRGGGTNALVVDHPDFRVDYHGASYRDHREIAADAGARVAVVDSFRLATDVDEPADLAEVLLHAPGSASGAWLREAGFDLVVREGRVGVGR